VLYVQVRALNVGCIVLSQLYMGRNRHSLAELPYAQLTSILFPQIWTTDWNSLVATDYCDWLPYFRSLFIETVFQLGHLSLHRELYICIYIFTVLVVSLSWPPVQVGRLCKEPNMANTGFTVYIFTTHGVSGVRNFKCVWPVWFLVLCLWSDQYEFMALL